MFKFRIELDTDKISKQAEYSLEYVIKYLEKVFKNHGIHRRNEQGLIFCGCGDSSDLARISVAVNEIESNAWIIEHSISWTLLHNSFNEMEWDTEDWLSVARNKKTDE